MTEIDISPELCVTSLVWTALVAGRMRTAADNREA